MADALLRTGEPMADRHFTLIRLLHSSAQQLLLISNNVLDVSAIWAGALTVHDGRFDLERYTAKSEVVEMEGVCVCVCNRRLGGTRL